MKAVFLDAGSLGGHDLDFSPIFDILPQSQWTFYEYTHPQDIPERINQTQFIVTNKCVLAEHHFQANPQLNLIIVTATGTDNIDLEAASEYGIQVLNCRDYCTGSVAQHTLGLLLALSSKQHQSIQNVRQGAWQAHPQFSIIDHAFSELAGKTLGVVGFGALGQAIARIACAMDMKVQIAHSCSVPQHSDTPLDSDLNNSPYGPRIQLRQLFETSDFISLHCALSEYTHHLINKDTLNLMKPSAYLINTARGGLINEYDLKEALINGKIAGAALDVLSQEPPPNDHILLNEPLDNLLITPHSAWSSIQARRRLVDQIAKLLRSYLYNGPDQGQVL